MLVELEPQQIDVLLRVLTSYLSDLRMEIADTEQYDMREDLKQQEAVLKAVIGRLESADVRPA